MQRGVEQADVTTVHQEAVLEAGVQALRAGESPERLGVLPTWRDADVFTPAERAALEPAEATNDPADAEAQASAYAAARKALTEDQISAAIWVAITIGAFNRVSVMSKHPVRAAGRIQAPSTPSSTDGIA